MRLLLKRHMHGAVCACIGFVREVDSNPERTLIMNYKMRKQLALKFSNPCLGVQGVRNYSVPIGLDSRVLVDLVVVGSVAVSEKGKTSKWELLSVTALPEGGCVPGCQCQAVSARLFVSQKSPVISAFWMRLPGLRSHCIFQW